MPGIIAAMQLHPLQLLLVLQLPRYLCYEMTDDWVALFAAGFIFYNSYLFFRPALGEIMDKHTYDSLVQEIRMVLVTVEGIPYTENVLLEKQV